MGLYRLEVAKALGEQTIVAFLVDARIRWPTKGFQARRS
jgi:hypothetical protein